MTESLDRLAHDICAGSIGPVFGIPGSGATLSLLDSLDQRGHKFVLTRFEGAAAMMAGTIGRMGGQPGVCLSIKGPGFTNMVPGLAVSHFEAFPLVAIAEAYAAGSPPSRSHKRIDQAALAATLSKAITQLRADGSGFDNLAALSTMETPGPAILELAAPAPESPAPLHPLPLSNSTNGVQRVVDLIEGSERPIIIAGTLADRLRLSTALNQLKVPVFTTASAKGVIDESSPYSAGVFTGVGLGLSPEHHLLKHADRIVCIGIRPNEVLAVRSFSVSAVNVSAVHEAGEEDFGFEAIADAGVACEVLSAVNNKAWGRDLILSANDRIRCVMLSKGFLPAHAFELIQKYFGGNIRGVFDTGYFCTIAEHIWRARTSSHCLMSGQSRYMGTGIPMGLAAAIYDQSLPTIAFVGDGGIGPFVGEVKIAVEHRLPILFCLLSDGRFASIRTRALQDGLTELPLTPRLPSWLAVMEGFGMPAYRGSDESEVLAAVEAWDPQEGPGYLEISFEPDSYEAMVRDIR